MLNTANTLGLGMMTSLTPASGSGSHQRSGLMANKMINDSLRKTTDHHNPANSTSPKNIIVKTNKFLFKNIQPPEPQRAPKGDMGN